MGQAGSRPCGEVLSYYGPDKVPSGVFLLEDVFDLFGVQDIQRPLLQSIGIGLRNPKGGPIGDGAELAP